jgi:predicted Zn-dependent protease
MFKKGIKQLMTFSPKKILHLGLITLLTLPFSGCQKNAEGRKVLQLMPTRDLRLQAEAAYRDQLKEIKLSKDARYQKIIKRITNRITTQAEKMYGEHCRGFNWEVQLIDDDKTVNAYCMPGGKMAIYTGMLKVAQTEAAVAAVMGHEVAHALLKHANERMTQAKGLQIGLALGQVAVKEAEYKDGKYDRYLMAALGLGGQIGLLLPYSRIHESESDRMGLKLSSAAGYEPMEAPRLWERMKAQSKGAPPEFLSTHPDNDRRIRDLTALIPSVQGIYNNSPKYGKGEKL